MFLVGHAMVGFLIAYGLVRILGRSSDRRKGAATTTSIARISFALVMLLAVLPDIDIVFQALGIMPHKTYTHSVILDGLLVAPAIFVVARWSPLRQTLAASLAYSLAYAQHMFDDIVVGTLNVAYPFGNVPVGIGIAYGSVYHLALEIALVAVVAVIVVSRSFGNAAVQQQQLLKSGQQQSTKFPSSSSIANHYHGLFMSGFGKLDKLCFALLVLSLLVSFAYLLQEMKSIPRLYIDSELEVALFVVLHLSALALVSFMILVSRENAKLVSISGTGVVRDM